MADQLSRRRRADTPVPIRATVRCRTSSATGGESCSADSISRSRGTRTFTPPSSSSAPSMRRSVAGRRICAPSEPITTTSRRSRPCPGWRKFSVSPSPRRSATSPGSRAQRSSSAAPGCALLSASPAARTIALRWSRTAPSTCAGPSSKPPHTPPGTRPLATPTSTPHDDSASSGATRSLGWRCPKSSPRPAGTCSQSPNPSLRQSPNPLWPLDGPHLSWT